MKAVADSIADCDVKTEICKSFADDTDESESESDTDSGDDDDDDTECCTDMWFGRTMMKWVFDACPTEADAMMTKEATK